MSMTPHVGPPAATSPYSAEVLKSRLTDPRRLQALRASTLLDGAQNSVLDGLTRLVSRFLGVPISLVSLVDDREQHFPGLTGLEGWAGERRGTELTHSFCQHVVGRDAMLVVDDAAIDPLCMDNPAVRELGMIAYLGVPLRTASGDTIGALCAIDTKPLQWTAEQVATLEDLAAAAMAEIELRSATLAMRAEVDRYEFLVDAADLGDWDMDVRQNLTRRSAKHDALFGYAEMLPSWGYDDFLAHVHPEDRDRVHAAYQRALAGDGDYNVELRTIWPDGTLHWLWSRGRFVLDADGSPVRAAGLMADITDRKLSDERIMQLDREDTVGRLAAGLAHDFNNQLTVILGTVDCMALSPDLTVEQREDLGQIQGSCKRSARMVRELLALSRNEVRHREPVNLAGFLREVSHTAEHLVGERVRCRFVIPDSEFAILGDAPQIEQLLLNLLTNARDAMPNGGTVTITLEAHSATQVVLRVADTGMGMDERTLQRCFETFYTTKPRGAGTGLGLASVRRLVTDMGGEIGVTSVVGAGTTFALRFPLYRAADEPHGGMGTGHLEDAASHGALRVLLVDDNAIVRQVVTRVLRENGHTVVDEETGEAAVARLLAHDAFDVLITDLVMPTMNGRALADAVLARHPTTRVLLISGYSDDEVARYGIERGTYAFLAKPFTRAQLQAAVDALVASRGSVVA